jgi:tetratricopeptide (TPR) repeat protein
LEDKEPNQNDEQSTADQLLSTSTTLFICDNCGAFLSTKSDQCGVCGVEIEEAEDMDVDIGAGEKDRTQEAVALDVLSSKGTLTLCPQCGAFVQPESISCGICGSLLEEMEEHEKENIGTVEAKGTLQTKGELYLCGKCGAFLNTETGECANCSTKTLREPPKMKPGELKKKNKKIAVLKVPKRTKAEVIDDCTKLLFKKAIALKKLGRYTEALKCLIKALDLSPKDRTIMAYTADTYYELKRYKNSMKLYKHILETELENVLIWNRLGNSLFKLGHQKHSLLCYEKVLSLDPNNREAMINKGYLLMKQKRYDEAMACAEKVAI